MQDEFKDSLIDGKSSPEGARSRISGYVQYILPLVVEQSRSRPSVLFRTNIHLWCSTSKVPPGTDILATCRELGVTIVAAMPLGRSLLTSTFARGDFVADVKENRPHVIPRFMEANRDKNVEVANQFKTPADKNDCTISELAIAWLLKQGDDILPIPGTEKLKYLEENCGALNVHLTDQEKAEIRHFAEAAEIAGHYVPSSFEIYTFRDTREEESWHGSCRRMK